MTQQQISLVQQSWTSVLPLAKEAGLLFYNKLFEAAPALRHLFKPDISEQANKLVMILSYVVSKLNHMEELLPEVQKLGVRHNRYGTEPSHYELVGQCLLATLKEGLGPQWNAEIQDAWITAYNTLKNVMIIAQEEEKKYEAERIE
ncbi:MAG TPA: globin family protein [Chitinophagaceae bacterium]|nr:globin family protein [Chitinophagaceae bacterium]